MPAKGHQIIHAVVSLRNTTEYARHSLRLLGLSHRLKAKVCLAVCSALRIFRRARCSVASRVRRGKAAY